MKPDVNIYLNVNWQSAIVIRTINFHCLGIQSSGGRGIGSLYCGRSHCGNYQMSRVSQCIKSPPSISAHPQNSQPVMMLVVRKTTTQYSS